MNTAPIWCDEIRQVIQGKNPEDAIRMAKLRIKSTYETHERKES